MHQPFGRRPFAGDEGHGGQAAAQRRQDFRLAGRVFRVVGRQKPERVGMFLGAALTITDYGLCLPPGVDLGRADPPADTVLAHQIDKEGLRRQAEPVIGEMDMFLGTGQDRAAFRRDPDAESVAAAAVCLADFRRAVIAGPIAGQDGIPGPNGFDRPFGSVGHTNPGAAQQALIIVTDAADIGLAVLVALGQEAQPEILRDVGVLILVDQEIAEQAAVLPDDVLMLGEDRQIVQQQVAEIAGIQDLQAFLILAVDFDRATIGDLARLRRGQAVRRLALVLPALDDVDQHARGPALVVDMLRLQDLLQQADLIVCIQDGEVRFQADQLRMAAQDARAQRMEGAQPHALRRRADQIGHPLLHLARGLVGEGDAEDLIGLGPAFVQDLGEARGQDPGLARARTGQHQHRPVDRLHRLTLGIVQPLQPGRRRGRTARIGGRGAAGRREVEIVVIEGV